MNHLIDWLPADGWPRFLADAAWQSVLASLLGLACIHLFARRPTTKSCASLCTIVAVVTLPIITVGVRLAGWGLLPAALRPAEAQLTPDVAARSNERATNDQSTEALTSVSNDTAAADNVVPENTPQQVIPVRSAMQRSTSVGTAPILASIWIVLSGALIVRLVASVWQTRTLLREAVANDDVVVAAAVQAASVRLEIVSPRVLASKTVKLPTVFAFGSGIVLLPTDKLAFTDAIAAEADRSNEYASLFAILCHELGHIRRHDGRNRLIVELALVLLPWQPLVWLLRRGFLRYAEEACDDWAVASGVNPLDYATVLADLIPSIPSLSLGATIMTTDAKSRILRLLALRETPRPRTTWPQLGAIATAACAIIATVALAQRPADVKEEPSERSQISAADETQNTSGRNPAKSAETIHYVLEPPDVVTIDVVRLIPKSPYRIRAVDVLQVDLEGESPLHKVDNMLFVVEPGGHLNLGAAYGKVKVAGLSPDEARDAVEAHLRRMLERPRVTLTLYESAGMQQVAGKHTVGPDGHLNLGAFGQVHVSGMTPGEARKAIEKKLSDHFEKPSISLALQSDKQFQGISPRDRAAAESKSVYVLEPPDIIAVEPIRLLPKGPQRIERLDQLEIEVSGTLEEAPIKGSYQVDADGEISLGPEYGRLNVAGLTVKETIQKIDEHLSKTLVQPEVAVRITDQPKNKQVGGTHLIGPDGHINLGTFGQVYVAGMTVDETREAIEKKLAEHFDKPAVAVDVTAYNSKVYYVIVQGGGEGDSVFRFPLTGNDTVLDALAQVNVTLHKNTSMWISRPTGEKESKTLRIDWAKITSGGNAASNYQLRPGDRVFLQDAVTQNKAVEDPTRSNSAFGPPRNSNRGLTGRIDHDSSSPKFGF